MSKPESQPNTSESGLFPASGDPMRMEVTFLSDELFPEGSPYPPDEQVYREAEPSFVRINREAEPSIRVFSNVEMLAWGVSFRPEDIVHLAAGGTYAADSWVVSTGENEQQRVRGIVRLCWPFPPGTWLGGTVRLATDPVLELQSDLPLEGLDFQHWQEARFSGQRKFWSNDPGLKLWLVRKWIKETGVDVRGPAMAGLLVSASIDNIVDEVRGLIAMGADVNALDRNGETALAAAMENAGEFGENGFSWNRCHRMHRYNPKWQVRSLPDEGESTWLPRAKECVRILREAGATDYSAIIHAAAEGDEARARHLLAEGFPVGFSICAVGTPLTMAARCGHTALVKLFLEAGADPNQPACETSEMFCEPDHTYPFQYALGDPAGAEILQLLVSAGARLDTRGEVESLAPVIFRCPVESDEVAKAIMSTGWNMDDLRDGHGRNWLHVADAKTLGHILPHVSRAMREHISFEGFTPLAEVVARGDLAKTTILLANGANPNSRCSLASCPASLTEFSSGLDPLFDEEGKRAFLGTPLLQAARHDNYALAELLLRHGADAKVPCLAVSLPTDQESNRSLRKILLDFLSRHRNEINMLGGIPSDLNSPEKKQSFVEATEQLHESECALVPAIWLREPGTVATLAHLVEEVPITEIVGECSRPVAALLRKGAPLSPWELLEATCAEIEEVLRPRLSGHFEGEEQPHALRVQADIHKTEAFYKLACEMLGRQPEPDLSEWVIETAEEEFSGGVGRAAKAANSGEGLEFDDFITALGEHFAPGTKLDDGKLRQSSFAAADALLKRCQRLLG